MDISGFTQGGALVGGGPAGPTNGLTADDARQVALASTVSTLGGREQATLGGIQELFELLNIIMIAKLLDAPIDRSLITRLRDMGLDGLAQHADAHNESLARREGRRYTSPLEQGVHGVDMSAAGAAERAGESFAGTAAGQAVTGSTLAGGGAGSTGGGGAGAAFGGGA